MANHQQISKLLICQWKDCDLIFEKRADFQEHVNKHAQEHLVLNVGNPTSKDCTGTEEESMAEKPLDHSKNTMAKGIVKR
jgi:uncharacterized C2H2 Zn-finger protein